MKRAYEKPMAVANNEFIEGVYMASGAEPGSDCYTVSANIHQTPETGREDYRIQVNANHAADDSHHSGKQTLVISFNQPVHFSFCTDANATLKSGDGTETLKIVYHYHNNGNDHIGLGDLVVTSGEGLAISGTPELICNHDCGQH